MCSPQTPRGCERRAGKNHNVCLWPSGPCLLKYFLPGSTSGLRNRGTQENRTKHLAPAGGPRLPLSGEGMRSGGKEDLSPTRAHDLAAAWPPAFSWTLRVGFLLPGVEVMSATESWARRRATEGAWSGRLSAVLTGWRAGPGTDALATLQRAPGARASGSELLPPSCSVCTHTRNKQSPGHRALVGGCPSPVSLGPASRCVVPAVCPATTQRGSGKACGVCLALEAAGPVNRRCKAKTMRGKKQIEEHKAIKPQAPESPIANVKRESSFTKPQVPLVPTPSPDPN